MEKKLASIPICIYSVGNLTLCEVLIGGHMTLYTANIMENLTIFFSKKSNAQGFERGRGGWARLDLTDTKD